MFGHQAKMTLSALAAAALLTPPLWAAEPANANPNADQQQKNRQTQQSDRQADQQADQLDRDKGHRGKMMHARIDRANQLLGRNVQDSTGKRVGEIEDLVVERNTGRIAYVALRYDQTLGFGGKLVAVSPDALTHTGQDKPLRLSIQAGELRSAPSIDEQNWPDTGDRTWRQQLDQFYNVSDRRATARPESNVGLAERQDTAAINEPYERPDLEQRNQRGKADAVRGEDRSPMGGAMRMSRLIGLNVHGQQAAAQADADAPQGQAIGEIRDVLIHRQANRAMFVLVDFGGTLGVGQSTAVAPFASLDITERQDTLTAQLNASTDTLKQNTLKSEQDIDALAQGDRSREIFRSYNQTPHWETFGYEADMPRRDRSQQQPDRERQSDQDATERSDQKTNPARKEYQKQFKDRNQQGSQDSDSDASN